MDAGEWEVEGSYQMFSLHLGIRPQHTSTSRLFLTLCGLASDILGSVLKGYSSVLCPSITRFTLTVGRHYLLTGMYMWGKI